MADTEDWIRLNYKPHSLIPDLSFLNEKPAGTRGRVVPNGADLAFEDGTPVRFWGANIQASALFQTRPPAMQAHAKRLASLGFNLVRLHHHDSHWVKPIIFLDPVSSTAALDPDALRILDRWIEALKSEVIYLWLDIHVGRNMVRGDRIDLFQEISDEDGRADIRGYNFVSPTIQDRMLAFQRAYLTNENHISGLRYADDPAIVAVLISNENDATHHFGNRMLPDKGVPKHTELYMDEANRFADANALDRNLVWRSWEAGPSKIFLNDLEHRFFSAFEADLQDIGYRGMIVPTNFWGNMPLLSLPSLSTGAMIDVHAYESVGEIYKVPSQSAGSMAWMASGQVAGMPLSITEWNAANYPQDDGFILPLRMAALSSHQGWDAPMIYGYAQQPLNGPQRPRSWSVAGDPSMMATFPASALLYRQGHVREAERTYALRLTSDQFFGSKISPENSLAIRTIYEQSKLVVEIPEVPELPWLKARRAEETAIPIEDPNMSFLPTDATTIEADTGDFRRDFAKGIFVVDTPLSQVAAGNLAEDTIDLANIRVDAEQSLTAIALQSLNGSPIGTSEDLLITATARIRPTSKRDPLHIVEPVSGEIAIKAAPGLTLKDLRGEPLPFEMRNDSYVIDLEAVSGKVWMRLTR